MTESAAKQNPQRQRGLSAHRTQGGHLAQAIEKAPNFIDAFPAADSVMPPV
jgi:hypothetical protein